MIGDKSIDELIAASSIGQGLADIKARGIDAHLAELEQELAPVRKRRKSSTSPTQRTLAELRKRGWTAQVVERRLPRTFTTVDLFGVIDLVALVPAAHLEVGGSLLDGAHVDQGGAILGIQATTGAHHADRRAKILAEPRAREWVAAGGRLELWTWSQRVAHNRDGSKARRPCWTLRVETFSVADWSPA